MYLEEAYVMFEELRVEFRQVLEKNGDLKTFFRKALDKCYGNFDEQTLGENLKEEYQCYLKCMAA